jgi:hypothetical protein
MAQTRIDKELFDRIRKLGVRKSRAREVADAVRNSPKNAPKAARKTTSDLQGAAAEIQDRINGGPAEPPRRRPPGPARRRPGPAATARKKAAKTRAQATA